MARSWFPMGTFAMGAMVGAAGAAGLALAAHAQEASGGPELRIRVDPRVELVCAVLRLADFREYTQARVASYAEDVDAYFDPVRDHPVFAHAGRLRAEQGLGYDAGMLFAIHLSDDFDLLPSTSVLVEDERWTRETARAFAADLRDLAELTELDAFLAEQRELYELTETRLRAVLDEHADLGWFERFFGVEPAAPFTLVPGLLNGPASYGVRYRDAEGREHLYAILGVEWTDRDGLPRFPAGAVSTVVHEFGHSFVNPLVHAHADALRASGERLFEEVRPQMERQAYGRWSIMLCESLVRACEVRYALDRGEVEGARRRVDTEVGRGFLWTQELVDLLGEYERDRARHPTLERFMPRVVAFLDATARRAEAPRTDARSPR